MTRTFIAIELSDEARVQLSREIRRLAQALPRLRWVDPSSLHLTLAFLDELNDLQLEVASQIALDVARKTQPFGLAIGTLGTFGPAYSPRVIWAGVAGQLHRLFELQSRLASSLAAKGFPPDEHPYSPHLTLARIKDRLSAQELATLRRFIPAVPATHTKKTAPAAADGEKSTLPVQHLSVMKSELLRAGPRYTRLCFCPFET